VRGYIEGGKIFMKQS